ncbi:MAG: hypothetical protein ACRC46_14565 [Thermoguttaceae bacterium]
MTQNKVFIRKVVYGVLIAILLVPLYILGRPVKTVMSDGVVQMDAGGVLAKIRTENHLADAQIGEVDPSSAALKLATFGLRGVAIAMLWYRANQFEKIHDWNNVVATGNQIVFLEPHFRTIWEFLGWKLSYNASADFDDYRERYRWVIRGFDFVVRGLLYNQQEPKLEKWAGWTISQKIGIADENEQYRRLLRDDEAFGLRHSCTLPSERDNWLLGRRWYQRGEKLIGEGFMPGQETLFLYFSRPRLNLVNYAVWIRKDGAQQSCEPIFGAVAIEAWKHAETEWAAFGKMVLPTAVMNPEKDVPFMTSLDREDEIDKIDKKLVEELKSISPGFSDRVIIERWNKLDEVAGQQAVMLPLLTKDPVQGEELQVVRRYLDDTEPDWRERLQRELDALYTSEQRSLKKIPMLFLDAGQKAVVDEGNGEVQQIRSSVHGQLLLTPKVIAELLQDDTSLSAAQRGRARDIANEIESYATDKQKSNIYRGIINYPARAREIVVEQTTDVDDARHARYLGRKAYYSSDPVAANKYWLESMQKWDDLFNKPGFEDLKTDITSATLRRDTLELVKLYAHILDANRAIYPLKYPLQWLVYNEVNNYGAITDNLAAQQYAKEAMERGELDASFEYAKKLLGAWESLNRSDDDYMRLSPLPEIRTAMIDAMAMYVVCLRKLQQPFTPDIPGKSFVDEMMRHDPLIEEATVPTERGLQLVREKKMAEARTELATAMPLWEKVLAKYPIIAVDPAQGYRDLLTETATAWRDASQATGEPVASPLNEFLPQ